MRVINQAILLASLALASVSAFAAPIDGVAGEPFKVNNEVICLKEIQQQMTPYLKSFEEEQGVEYKYIVKAGLSYNHMAGLRLEVKRVDAGLNDHIADIDYYWVQERGSMCQPAYLILDRTEK
ncbi:hypothetical protein [Pantoea cypripedii]|uniref:Uncharacterized protein n=1 Tax=Pantoea cypripedii TaxID=55209 RepID=A0A6B9GF31_PANCY|nr:hypothetical protein [Pantoea cypripedii]QGY31636.1 hypothetical protein CUN67_21870 [Pantoea cypripedii]